MKCSQISRAKEKEGNCKISEVRGCCFEKNIPGCQLHPELWVLPLALLPSPVCTSGSAGTSAGNSPELFLHPCVGSHLGEHG